MTQKERTREVEIIGVPLDLGQNERGTDVGPAAMRYAGLVERLSGEGHRVFDSGNLVVPQANHVPVEARAGAIASACQELFERCQEARSQGRFPLILGGDHSVAIGSVAASVQGGSLGVIWVDAHGDFNTLDTSPSGNIHGMPLSVLLGDGEEELLNVGGNEQLVARDVVLIGIRQLDAGERRALKEAEIRTFSMRDVDERGMGQVAEEALNHLAHCQRLHLSLDIDALDPAAARPRSWFQ